MCTCWQHLDQKSLGPSILYSDASQQHPTPYPLYLHHWVPWYYMVCQILSNLLAGVIHNKGLKAAAALNTTMLAVI